MTRYAIVAWGAPLEARTSDVPSPRGREVLVAVDRCGVCHSDVHIRDGVFDLGSNRVSRVADLGTTLPFTMGHEIVGTVAAVGADVTAVRVGMPVVVYPWIGCGKCVACVAGREVDCDRNESLGTRRDGGFAEYVLVADERYVLAYDGIDPNVAATAACSILTAFAAIRKAGPLTADETLLVVGAGGVGLAATALARRLTPARVAVTDRDETKLPAAREAGAELTFSSEGLSPGGVRKALGAPARAAIDFVGSPETFNLAFRSVGKGGTVVIVGLFGGSTELSVALLPLLDVSLRGSYVGSLEQLRELLGVLRENASWPVPLRTRPMRDVNDVLDELKAGRVLGRVIATNG